MSSELPNQSVTIKSIIAGNGDCILLSFTDESNEVRNILIDGGNGIANYNDHIKPVLEDIIKNGEKLDLVIVTHIDQDHIKGVVYLTRSIQNPDYIIQPTDIGEYWFNSVLNNKIYQEFPKQFDVSAAEMQEFEKFLHNQPDNKWDINKKIVSPLVMKINGANLTILSPNNWSNTQFKRIYNPTDIGTYSNDYEHSLENLFKAEMIRYVNKKEELDDRLENAASIAFLLEYENNSILHLGDAIPDIVDIAVEELINKRSLKRLKVDVVKLSHHASRKNLSFKLLKLIDCNNFLICANGKKAGLPNKSTFSKILLNPYRNVKEHITFYFNYHDFSKVLKFTDQEKEKLNFSCVDANFEHGYCLTLPI